MKSTEAISMNWIPSNLPPTERSDGYHLMRPWQEEAYSLLKDEQHSLLLAPTGSGKSRLMCLISAHKMINDTSLKCIMSFPQTIIANGCADAKLLFEDGSKYHWHPNHNLCKNNSNTVDYVIEWLGSEHDTIADRTLLCTSATLTAVYKRLKLSNRRDLLNNLIIWIDEAHHIQVAESAEFEGKIVPNELGNLIIHCMDAENLHLGLSTATFGRGDRRHILPKHFQNEFVKYELPFDRHLNENMKYMKSFSVRYITCGPDFMKAIETLQENKKDIVYIPPVNSRHHTGDKYYEVEQVVSIYGNRKGIDLVNEHNRDIKKLKLLHQVKNRDGLDYIVTLGMFKEGADWPWAERTLIVGFRNSLTDLLQMIGRLFRDVPGKECTEVIILLPFSVEQHDKEKYKDQLNDHLKAMLLTMMLEDILNPVALKSPKLKTNTGKELVEKEEDVNWLIEAIPDHGERLEILEEIKDKLIPLCDTEDSVSEIREKYFDIVPEVLAEHGITENVEEIGDQVWAMFARQSLRQEGIDVSKIDIQLLRESNPLSFILAYTSDLIGVDTFRKLRDIIGGKRNFIPYEELKNKLHEMRKNGQPIDSSNEYYVWRKHNCNYQAVIDYRLGKVLR